MKKRVFCTYKNFKQALNHRLLLKKMHRIIKFKQEAWSKPYIDVNTELIKTCQK